MAFRPLKAFNGLLDRMAPSPSYGGLLSPQDERAAAQAYRAQLAAGLLAAAGPQTRPVSLGQAFASAIPQATAARDQRAEVGLRNEQMRREIERETRQTAANERLGEVLRASGPEGELMGLLHTVNPQATSEALIGGLLGGGDQREPADIQIMRTLGLPLTPEGFARYQEIKSEDGDLLKGLQLQMQQLQLSNMKREQEKEEQQARETQLTRANAIERGLDQTKKIADLIKGLEGTALAAGLPASEWRRSGIGALAAVGGALGFDVEEVNADITKFDTLKKNLNDQLISLMSSGSLGQGTDSKLQQYRDSLASPDTAPGAVMAIQAGIAETLLDQADVLGIEVPNREKVEESIEAMRNYQPAGAETVFDVPEAAAATGRAAVRVADIARMSLERLNQLDPASLTPEAREAAAKRWDELNAR